MGPLYYIDQRQLQRMRKKGQEWIQKDHLEATLGGKVAALSCGVWS